MLPRILIFLSCILATFTLLSQDSIRAENLKPFSYPFDIENGKLTGPGAAILEQAIADAHIVMLGDHSRSKLESDFSNVLVRMLNQNNFKTMVWEIGVGACEVINRLSETPKEAVQNFKALNKSYHFDREGVTYTPMPDLKSVEAAKLIEYIREENWSLLSVGTEAFPGTKLLVNEMYRKLSTADQKKNQKLHEAAVLLIDQLINDLKGQRYADVLKFADGLKSSNDFNDFLDAMSLYKQNEDMVNSLKFSVDYWYMYGNKEGFKKNSIRTKKNKIQLRKGLSKIDFDFNKDKLFLKMWRGHLTKGTTANGFYGVGNTLMELTEYHGHSSLAIGVLWRYSDEDGKITDALENPDNVPVIFRNFIELGQKEDWVLIDLRPFNKTFAWGDYHLTLEMSNMIKRYDMILIPKVNRSVEINY